MADSVRCEALAAFTFVTCLFRSTWRLWERTMDVRVVLYYFSFQKLELFAFGVANVPPLLPANPDIDGFNVAGPLQVVRLG